MKFGRGTPVPEQHIIRVLRDKRSELAGMLTDLEQKLGEHRIAVTHLDATLRLFDPEIRPEEIRPRQPRTRSAWFRPGECLRLIYDVLRDAPQPLTTREIADRIIDMKAMITEDERRRALIQKVVLGSLSRTKDMIERVETAGVIKWRVRQAARARCQ
jgi:hypothetical protein